MDLLSGLKRVANSREKRLVNIADLSDGFRGLLKYLSEIEKKQKDNDRIISSISASSTSGEPVSELLLMGG
jgi:hypothetical protein